MEYGYKPTTHGRALIAACAALEKPLTLTRVAIGSGVVPEGTNLADVHELVSYVADGTIGERLHEDDRLHLTIQYDNSSHPEQKTFSLAEFIVYATDPETGEEVDLIYATLGDYQQPVPAYNTAYPASVFSFPLVLIISDEINVDITAAPGIVTHDDLQRLLNEGVIGISRTELTIPADGWTDSEPNPDDEDGDDPDDLTGEWTCHLDIYSTSITSRMTPMVTIYPESLGIARSCNFCPTCRTMDGVLRLYAKSAPSQDIKASLALIGGSGYIGTSSDGSVTDLPVASATQAGAVKPGDGLVVSEDGTLSVDTEQLVTDDDLVDEDEAHQSVVDILNS